jgi:hypothetical protein
MVGRFLAVALGVAGAVAGSQAPGFTLQYMQHLNGRVEALRPIVEQFDADVGRIGYNRANAIAECDEADGLLQALCGGYARTVRDYERYAAHLSLLREAGDYARPLVVARHIDRDVAEGVMAEFKPAIPTTLDGAAYAAGGFAVVWGVLSFLFGFLGALTGGRRYA